MPGDVARGQNQDISEFFFSCMELCVLEQQILSRVDSL